MKTAKSCSIISLAIANLNEKEGIKENILKIFEKTKEEIKNLAEKENVNSFFFGMEQGAELLAAEYVADNKEKLGATVTCVMPFEEQAAEYSEEERDIYYSVFSKADTEIIYKKHREQNCKKERDLFMIEKSDFIIILNCEKQGFIENYISASFENKQLIFVK